MSMFELPEWMPSEAWDEYVKMRIKIKRPLTIYAMKLAVGKLDKLRQMGEDVQGVLDQSTFNSWQGLFEVHGEENGRATKTQQRNENSKRGIAKGFGLGDMVVTVRPSLPPRN